jgi:ABC-type glutathione transport system ATPase component
VTLPLEVTGLGYVLAEQRTRAAGGERVIVQDVSFAVGVGETLVLLGRSG